MILQEFVKKKFLVKFVINGRCILGLYMMRYKKKIINLHISQPENQTPVFHAIFYH